MKNFKTCRCFCRQILSSKCETKNGFEVTISNINLKVTLQ